MKCCLPITANSNPRTPKDLNSSFPMHEFKPLREGRWSKCNLFNMACSLLSGKKKGNHLQQIKVITHTETALPGTKLFLVVKTVNKWWKWGWGGSVVLWSLLSLFKISTVACLFPLHGQRENQQLRQEALWPWHPISGTLDSSLDAGSTGWWTNRIQVPEQVPSRPTTAQLCAPLNHHQLGRTGHPAKVIQRAWEEQQRLGCRVKVWWTITIKFPVKIHVWSMKVGHMAVALNIKHPLLLCSSHSHVHRLSRQGYTKSDCCPHI